MRTIFFDTVNKLAVASQTDATPDPLFDLFQGSEVEVELVPLSPTGSKTAPFNFVDWSGWSKRLTLCGGDGTPKGSIGPDPIAYLEDFTATTHGFKGVLNLNTDAIGDFIGKMKGRTSTLEIEATSPTGLTDVYLQAVVNVNAAVYDPEATTPTPAPSYYTRQEVNDLFATLPEGPQGAQGEDGADGPQGNQGVQGTVGQTGPQGLTGATGANGSNGANGSTGPQGVQGTVGETGAQGAPGTTDYDNLTNKPTLGTAAALNAGTSANNVIKLDSNGYLQATVLILPTSDPNVAGALWNNSGTIAISAPSSSHVKVSGAYISNAGSGFSENDTIGVNFGMSSLTVTPWAATVTSVDENGAITGISVTNEGDYIYAEGQMASPPNGVTGGTGSGAEITYSWVSI